MIDAKTFNEVLVSTFDQSALIDFRHFLDANPGVKKWSIAADFCLQGKERPNSAYAFTIIPYDAYPQKLFADINDALPRDLKGIKRIEKRGIDFLGDKKRFHFGFVFQKPPDVFYNGPGSHRLNIARESIENTLQELIDSGRGIETLKPITALRQAAKSNGFNVRLLADAYVLTYLFSFVTLMLARERQVEVVGWFADRDSMATFKQGFVWTLGYENVRGLAQQLSIRLPEGMPLVAVEDPNDSGSAMWYDEYIRLPDYIAGILSAWDFTTNLIHSENPKYIQLAHDVIADTVNTAIILVDWTVGLHVSRITFSKEHN